jgi:hypothetical protein
MAQLLHEEPASVVTVPRRWAKLILRLLGLQPGRYQITLSIDGDGVAGDWTVLHLGAIEVPK